MDPVAAYVNKTLVGVCVIETSNGIVEALSSSEIQLHGMSVINCPIAEEARCRV